MPGPEYSVQMGRARSFVPEIRRSIVAGEAAAEVASIELILANGGTLHAEIVERPLGLEVPLNVYWAELGRSPPETPIRRGIPTALAALRRHF